MEEGFPSQNLVKDKNGYLLADSHNILTDGRIGWVIGLFVVCLHMKRAEQ
jgi:hypothetical protein